MILGVNESEIVKLAVEGQSNITDGVVFYDYEEEQMFSASFTTGTVEDPSSPFIEVFRLPQGERGEIRYECDECPFKIGFVDEEERKLYAETMEECCFDAYCDDDFQSDFDNNWRELVEHQISRVLTSYLGETLDKLDEIRIAIFERVKPSKSIGTVWKENVLENYVDLAMEDGFCTCGEPEGYLEAEIIYIKGLCEVEYENREFWESVKEHLNDWDLTGALEMLQ